MSIEVKHVPVLILGCYLSFDNNSIYSQVVYNEFLAACKFWGDRSMDLNFELGNKREPKGHALVHFRDDTGGKSLVTYVVVTPVKVDFTKYIPPMMAGQVDAMDLKDFHAFALPPIPEEVEGTQYIRNLAEARGDDLINGGALPLGDLSYALQKVNELVQAYAKEYSDYAQRVLYKDQSPSFNETMYSLMSTHDRLIELSKLMGKLRFATEGKDHGLSSEVQEEIGMLRRQLPDSYRVGSLLEAVLNPASDGAELAQLYLERCYKLSEEDYAKVIQLEERIHSLESNQ